jgi:hypothetical protein
MADDVNGCPHPSPLLEIPQQVQTIRRCALTTARSRTPTNLYQRYRYLQAIDE